MTNKKFWIIWVWPTLTSCTSKTVRDRPLLKYSNLIVFVKEHNGKRKTSKLDAIKKKILKKKQIGLESPK